MKRPVIIVHSRSETEHGSQHCVSFFPAAKESSDEKKLRRSKPLSPGEDTRDQ